MKNVPIIVVVLVIVALLYVFRSKISRYDTEIWTKYKLKPIESKDLDDLMKTLKDYKKAYDDAKELKDKIQIRVEFEDIRSKIRDWYEKTGKDLGLDSSQASDFAIDMILKNTI
jgi:hypothetical protein